MLFDSIQFECLVSDAFQESIRAYRSWILLPSYHNCNQISSQFCVARYTFCDCLCEHVCVCVRVYIILYSLFFCIESEFLKSRERQWRKMPKRHKEANSFCLSAWTYKSISDPCAILLHYIEYIVYACMHTWACDDGDGHWIITFVSKIMPTLLTPTLIQMRARARATKGGKEKYRKKRIYI